MACCNACGYQKKLDNAHKAGKQLHKDIPTFYSANPEFKGKTNKAADDATLMQAQQKSVDKKQGEGKKQTADEVKEDKERVTQLMRDGGEVNVLDAKAIDIDSTEMGK